MKKFQLFFVNLLMSAVRFGGILLTAIVLLISGLIWNDNIFAFGIGALILYVIITFVYAIHLYRTVYNLDGKFDGEFADMLENIRNDPEGFIQDAMDTHELHGYELLKLDDDMLYQTVCSQNLELVGEADDENEEYNLVSGARRVVYILQTYDSAMSDRGLCDFYSGFSYAAAQYLSDALEAVGAIEHKNLFESFNDANYINLSDLDAVRGNGSFRKLKRRYDFDHYDSCYYSLPSLDEYIVKYIREHIAEF